MAAFATSLARATLAAMLAGSALAGGALAQQRCDGTLCDLYYGSSSPAPDPQATAAKAAPTPLTVPSTGNFFTNMFGGSGGAPAQGGAPVQATASGAAAAPSQRTPFFNVGGGGITGNNRDKECGGTLCDLFHGHSGTASDGDATLSQSVSGTPISSLHRETAANQPPEPVAAPVPVAPTAAPQRRLAERAPPPKPSCAARAGDPWACYRH